MISQLCDNIQISFEMAQKTYKQVSDIDEDYLL